MLDSANVIFWKEVDVPFKKDNDHVIMNAHRPLFGQETCEATGIYGRFFTNIDLNEEFSADFISRNLKLDARIIIPLSHLEMMALALSQVSKGHQKAVLADLDESMVEFLMTKIPNGITYKEAKELLKKLEPYVSLIMQNYQG